MYRYQAEIETSGGILKLDAVSTGKGDEVLAIFRDDLGSWRKTYDDIESFQTFISSLHVKNRLKISESRG